MGYDARAGRTAVLLARICGSALRGSAFGSNCRHARVFGTLQALDGDLVPARAALRHEANEPFEGAVPVSTERLDLAEVDANAT